MTKAAPGNGAAPEIEHDDKQTVASYRPPARFSQPRHASEIVEIIFDGLRHPASDQTPALRRMWFRERQRGHARLPKCSGGVLDGGRP